MRTPAAREKCDVYLTSRNRIVRAVGDENKDLLSNDIKTLYVHKLKVQFSDLILSYF